MKVLFINLPYYGHVAPTIGLVQELIKQGCEVTYLLPFGWEDKLRASGAAFLGYKNHPKLSEQIKNAYDIAENVIKAYDLVIYEQFFFLGKHLAEKYNKPVVRIFTAPVTNKKLMQEYIDAGGALGIFRYKWIGKLWTKELTKGIPLKTDCWLDEIVENPPALNLVYTLKEYQPYADEFPQEQYKFLGASVYEREQEEIAFEKSDVPLIYISLGTVVKGARSFFRNCIEAFRNENATVIMSVGKDFQINRLGEIPDNFQIYYSVPQTTVLKQADVFITHGGMNSVSESLVAGVSMVVIPFMADQPTNARRITELGLGKSLSCKSINAQVLRDTVFSVMKDNKIIGNISAMKQRMSECPGNRGGAEMTIDDYQTLSDSLCVD